MKDVLAAPFKNAGLARSRYMPFVGLMCMYADSTFFKTSNDADKKLWSANMESGRDKSRAQDQVCHVTSGGWELGGFDGAGCLHPGAGTAYA